jgi:hypothetical protein
MARSEYPESAFGGKVVENYHQTVAVAYHLHARAGNIGSDGWAGLLRAGWMATSGVRFRSFADSCSIPLFRIPRMHTVL